MNNRKRYLIVMILCVLLNEVCTRLAGYYNWPVWLDMTGTALAAVILEPAAGLLVGLINNFFLAIFVYDASSLVYYSISAATALIVGLNLKKDGRIVCKRILPIILAVIVASTLLSGTLTLWHGGISNATAEQNYYHQLLARGWNPALACFASIGMVKVFDIALSAVLFAVCYLLLPKRLKTE
ncbi:MAG: hypothetical protein RR466_07385 [Hungatella sp.]